MNPRHSNDSHSTIPRFHDSTIINNFHAFRISHKHRSALPSIIQLHPPQQTNKNNTKQTHNNSFHSSLLSHVPTLLHLLHLIGDRGRQLVLEVLLQLLLHLRLRLLLLLRLFLHTVHSHHFRNVVLHHLLHALLQRHAAARAAFARARHLHQQLARLLVERVEKDVAAVGFDARADSRVQKLLNEANHLAVRVLDLVGVFRNILRLQHDRFVVRGGEEVQNGVEDRGIDVLPFHSLLNVKKTKNCYLTCHTNIIISEKNGLDFWNVEQLTGEGRSARLL